MQNKKNYPINARNILAEQCRLLQLEYDNEKREYEESVSKLGIERMKERGDCWFPVTISADRHNSLNQRIVVLKREVLDEEYEDDHNFEYGRPLSLFMAEEGDKRPSSVITGVVNYVNGDSMGVEVPDNARLPITQQGLQLGVMRSFDDTTYKAMFEALERTSTAKGRLAELRDIIYSHRPVSELKLNNITLPYLNDSQQRGVNKVLAAKDVAIVHGPPGTGKTTTLVEAVYETLRRESQVLVCAQSNSAVDLICERLADRGVSVLRIGNPARVNDKMLASTYEHRFEDHPEYPNLWSIRKSIRELRCSRKRSDQWHQKMERLKDRVTDIEFRINRDLFAESKVIASTLVGSTSKLLYGQKFSTLFIDEAAQALEAACWIPMRRAGRVILAGDHCQLPATVKSYEAAKQGLGKSLMERIVELHPETVTLLATQYRMNEAIMKFPNDWFYHGCMVAAPEVRHRGILDLDTPIEWVESGFSADECNVEGDTQDRVKEYYETLYRNTMGRINTNEAILTLQTLQNYVDKIGIPRIVDERIDIAVISPYRAQVRYLRGLLNRTPFFKPIKKLITINTIDGFQGRESDVVLISLVRSNVQGQIGFLRDLRRMNVAMTRARMKLIIIGDSTTLTKHPFYARLYRYIHDGGVMSDINSRQIDLQSLNAETVGDCETLTES